MGSSMLVKQETNTHGVVMNYSFERYEFDPEEYSMPEVMIDTLKIFSARFIDLFYEVRTYIPNIRFFELIAVLMELANVDTINRYHSYRIPYIGELATDAILERPIIMNKNMIIISIYNRQWGWDKERESELVDILYNSALKVIGDVDRDRIGLSIIKGLSYNQWE